MTKNSDEKTPRGSTRRYYVLRVTDSGDPVFTVYENKALLLEGIASGVVSENDPIYFGRVRQCDVTRTIRISVVNGIEERGPEQIDVVTRG